MTDWSALNGNPVPGDPASVRVAAEAIRRAGESAAQQRRLVTAVAGAGVSAWQGAAADGFRSATQAFVPALATLAACHRDAASALDTYAAQLAALQTTAGQLLVRARAAEQQLATAERSVAQLYPQVSQAARAYNTAFEKTYNACPALPSGPPVDGPFPVGSPGQLLQTYQALNTGLATAQQDWTNARSTLSSLQVQANALNAQAAAAAQRCADSVNQASKPAWASGATNVVSGVLASPVFTAASTLLAIPAAALSDLEKAAEESANRLTEAARAEQQVVAEISTAARDLHLGQTAAARSAASAILRNARAAKQDALAALDEAGDVKSAATQALDEFSQGWAESLPTRAIMGASKGLGFSWVDAYKTVSQIGKAGDSAAVEGAGPAADLTAAQLGVRSLGDVPVVGTVIAGGLTANDLRQHHYLNAVGDAGGFVATVATGTAVVLLASNPAGWVVLGVSAGVGVAVTEGIDHYKAVVHGIESVLEWPGQQVAHLVQGLDALAGGG